MGNSGLVCKYVIDPYGSLLLLGQQLSVLWTLDSDWIFLRNTFQSMFWRFRAIVHTLLFVDKIRQKNICFWFKTFEKSHDWGNFEISVPPYPSWSQNFYPIRNFAAISYYIYKYLDTLAIFAKSTTNVKGHLLISCPIPTHIIKQIII